MSSSNDIHLSISFAQLLDMVSRLPNDKKKKLVEHLRSETSTEIPENTQQLVQERFEEYKKNPEGSSDWEDYKKELDGL